MIRFALLLALAVCCSAGSLSPDRNYHLPSQTPNNQYLPPTPTQPPNKVYLPPSTQPTPNINLAYTPVAPNNQYLPPSPPPTPNKVYLSPSPPPTPSPVYLPPVSRPINAYTPPSPPASPNNVYLPPSKPNNVYLPPSSGSSFTSPQNSFGLSGNSFASNGITGAVFHQQVSSRRPVAILKQVNDNKGDGVYTFSYETEDGTTAEERGQLKDDGAEGSVSAQGSFSFTAPDNVRYTVTYTADENGFQPQGAHLPVPPPIPEAILKALADNAVDEARGIVDDGSYKEEPQGYPRVSAASTQADAGHYQRSSPNQGYPRERPADNGYQRDIPNQPFNF